MHDQPAFCDREIEPDFAFGRRALQLEQERPVDLLDIDAAVLHRLEGMGQFDQLAGGDLGIGEGAKLDRTSWLLNSKYAHRSPGLRSFSRVSDFIFRL